MFGLPLSYFLLAVVVTVLSAGRLTRLITADHWPPVDWAKTKWDTWTDRTSRRQGWQILAWCHWCLGPWMTLLIGGWAVLDVLIDGYIDWPWWLLNGWLAASYLTSILVHHDEGADDAT